MNLHRAFPLDPIPKVRYSFSTFSFVEYNVEDRKDARKREGRREREREETMENGRKEDEVREAEKRPRTGMHGSQICISMASNINYT